MVNDSVMILSLIAYCDISFTEQKDTRSFHIHFARAWRIDTLTK